MKRPSFLCFVILLSASANAGIKFDFNRNNQRISLLDYRKQLEETLFNAEKTYWDLQEAEQEVIITQRLLKARMFSDLLSNLHFWGWQAIIVAAALQTPPVPWQMRQSKPFGQVRRTSVPDISCRQRRSASRSFSRLPARPKESHM